MAFQRCPGWKQQGLGLRPPCTTPGTAFELLWEGRGLTRVPQAGPGEG